MSASLYPSFVLDITLDIQLDMAAIFAAVTILLILLCLWAVPLIVSFRDELKYINMEIQRTEGRERAHWEKKRRKLWLSLLPFVRYH